MTDFDNLTYLHGKPQGNGVLKASPEDLQLAEFYLTRSTHQEKA